MATYVFWKSKRATIQTFEVLDVLELVTVVELDVVVVRESK